MLEMLDTSLKMLENEILGKCLDSVVLCLCICFEQFLMKEYSAIISVLANTQDVKLQERSSYPLVLKWFTLRFKSFKICTVKKLAKIDFSQEFLFNL